MASIGHMVKESLAERISEELAERPNFFVTTVNRLSSPDADSLRQKLHTSKARLLVVKRRLGRRTVEKLNVAGLAELMDGSTGLVLAGEDALQAAKLIVEFIKTHENQLTVRGGLVDGQLLDKSRVEQLAALPPKSVLLAQVVGTLEAPIADVIFTLERLIGDIAWLAEQIAAQKPAEAPKVEPPKAEAPKAEAAPGPESKPATEPPDVKPAEPNIEEGKG